MSLNNSHSSSLTMVIDQGSHASRIALFSETGELVYLTSKNISTHSPEQTTGLSIYEHNGEEILHSVQTLLTDIPAEFSNNIKCAGLCTQRSTVVAWHKTSGKTLSPSISWRDTRSQPLIDTLSPSASSIRKITGLPLSAHYSAGKIQWLLQNNTQVKQAAKEKQLCISPLASYLLFHLLKEKKILIDHSNAQRCQLFDIQSLDWSEKLLQLFQIEKEVLPDCAPVIHLYGKLKLNNIPLTAVCGDQNAVLYAYPPLLEKSALINIGTGAFILSSSPECNNKNPALLHTLASSSAQSVKFVTEGTVNGAGAALSWAQENDPCSNMITQLPNWLKQVDSPPVFINSISKLGSPWWCDAGEPVFIGENTQLQAERYVAIIESILFLIYKNIQQLEMQPEKLLISGGLSQLDSLCQKLANLTQTKVLRFTNPEATARGCAWLANQAIDKNSLSWKALQFTDQFITTDKPSEQKNIFDRYQHFVGELNKRCRK